MIGLTGLEKILEFSFFLYSCMCPSLPIYRPVPWRGSCGHDFGDSYKDPGVVRGSVWSEISYAVQIQLVGFVWVGMCSIA